MPLPPRQQEPVGCTPVAPNFMVRLYGRESMPGGAGWTQAVGERCEGECGHEGSSCLLMEASRLAWEVVSVRQGTSEDRTLGSQGLGVVSEGTVAVVRYALY